MSSMSLKMSDTSIRPTPIPARWVHTHPTPLLKPQIPEKRHNHHQHAKHHHSRVSVDKASLCFANLRGDCANCFCRAVHDAVVNNHRVAHFPEKLAQFATAFGKHIEINHV